MYTYHTNHIPHTYIHHTYIHKSHCIPLTCAIHIYTNHTPLHYTKIPHKYTQHTNYTPYIYINHTLTNPPLIYTPNKLHTTHIYKYTYHSEYTHIYPYTFLSKILILVAIRLSIAVILGNAFNCRVILRPLCDRHV